MALGGPQNTRNPLGVLAMLAALVLSAFLGGALGLVWQNIDWLGGAPEDEVVAAADEAES